MQKVDKKGQLEIKVKEIFVAVSQSELNFCFEVCLQFIKGSYRKGPTKEYLSLFLKLNRFNFVYNLFLSLSDIRF